VKKNGENLNDDSEIALVSNLLHRLWSQIDLSLNNTLVSHSNNSYPYRAYLETLLSYCPAAKNSQLSENLWLEDTTDDFDTLGADNAGCTKRKAFTANSSEVDTMDKLHLDMCFKQRHFINVVDVKRRLIRAIRGHVLPGR